MLGWEGHAKVAGVANGKQQVQEWVLFVGAMAVDLGAVQLSVCAGFWCGGSGWLKLLIASAKMMDRPAIFLARQLIA